MFDLISFPFKNLFTLWFFVSKNKFMPTFNTEHHQLEVWIGSKSKLAKLYALRMMFKDQHSLFIIEEKMQKRNTTNTTTNEINLSHGRGKFYQSNQRRLVWSTRRTLSLLMFLLMYMRVRVSMPLTIYFSAV